MPKVSSAKVAGNQAWREQEVEKLYDCFHFRAHLPPVFLPALFSPLGTFNGMKLWACKSDNNCLGLKHNTLTGLTRPFSPPPLASRRGHLLLLLENQPQWQAIVVRRHFLCHYPLTLRLLSPWRTGRRKLSRSLKVFQEWSLLIATLMHANHWTDVKTANQ